MTAVMDRYERELLARQEWEALPHGGRDSVVMQVQCADGHELAKVFRTDAHLLVRTTVRPRSHGNRDLPDKPHTPNEMRRIVDMLEVDDAADDSIPAWCDCGARTLSRAALRDWLTQGEHRVIMD
jgi:hypothetical protein